MSDRTTSKKPVVESSEHPVLKHLGKQDLVNLVEDLREELRMSRAFSNISEAGANDAILQWQGRNRFLSEKIVPVRLKPITGESLYPDKGEHQIIDGDNLAVMTSLLMDFRGGPIGFPYRSWGPIRSGFIRTFSSGRKRRKYGHLIRKESFCSKVPFRQNFSISAASKTSRRPSASLSSLQEPTLSISRGFSPKQEAATVSPLSASPEQPQRPYQGEPSRNS